MLADPQARDRATYADTAPAFAPAIARVARAYEADSERARDLEQDIHLALWRGLATFRGECALSTWVFRVAHNVAASHVRRARADHPLVPIERAEQVASGDDPERAADHGRVLARLHDLLHRLAAADRQLILLYLEGLDAASMAEVSGLSPGHVAVKVHRIKALLARRFAAGRPL